MDIVVNCPNPVMIAIIDGTLIKTPESNSEEFTYQVDEEVGDDFDDDHESDMLYPAALQAPSSHLSVVKSAYSQSEGTNN